MSAPDPALVRAALAEAGEPDPGADLTVSPLAGGASRESWVIAERYVLKRDPPDEPEPAGSALTEFAAIRAATAAGVPVARPVCAEPPGGRFGTAGYVAAFVPGTASPRRLGALAAEERERVARDLGAALARLADVEPAPLVAGAGDEPVAAMLEGAGADLAELAPDRPALALALRWLEVNRPPPARAVLVHGDFRVGNFIVEHGRLAALVDWEFCRAGDPAEDLGFLCMRPWRFGAEDRRAGGLASLATVLEGRGAGVEPERVRYWEVVGQLRWGLYAIRQSRAYARSEHRHLERLVLGRRLAEVEWDLLDLIEEEAG